MEQISKNLHSHLTYEIEVQKLSHRLPYKLMGNIWDGSRRWHTQLFWIWRAAV